MPRKFAKSLLSGGLLGVFMGTFTICLATAAASLGEEITEGSGQPDFHVLQESLLERKTWWAALNFGAGALSQSGGGIDQDDTAGFLGFDVGLVVHPQFLVGIELSGWLLEESNLNDPSVGEGVMQAFLTTRYYPFPEYGLFMKLGGGYVSHWNNRPGEPSTLNGWGLNLGGGYDVLLTESLPVLPFVTPFITYSFGEAGDLRHSAITGGIGATLTGNGKWQRSSP